MAGSHISLIVMPIVIALALTFWISLVFRAMLNPLWKHHEWKSRTDVAGGVFEATHSARQLEPLWGEPVEAIPSPREAAYSESYSAEGAQAADQEPLAGEGAGAGARARAGATATGASATGSRPPTESGPTGSGWPPE